ncbi:amino acid permease-domain-containing protein [Chytriomyces cf. hyalinus JEL632]|nr:amino acid permease-domain-containing protein [Chytriomyces cf. hyalinus JEL632]
MADIDVKLITGSPEPLASSRVSTSKVVRPSVVLGANSNVGKQETSTLNRFGDKDEYLAKRKLMPAYANWIHVWGFIVGTVISGSFSGFNAGYANGLGSMIVAHVFASILMITVSLNLMELATAMPFASGCAAYASGAFNGVVACFIGYAYTFDMVFIGAEVTNFFGSGLEILFATGHHFGIVYHFLSIFVCMAINFYPKAFFNVITVSSAISCLMVVAPLFATASQFNYQNAFITPITSANGTVTFSTDFLPFGIKGVINSFPLALYLLICFESMPCCVEETQTIASSIPKGMFAANLTLIPLSWIGLVVTAGMPPGGIAIQSTMLPYSSILVAAFQLSSEQMVILVSLPAVFSSQLAIYYATTRYIYGMSRGGYMPPILSLTTNNGAPYTAMLATSTMFALLSIVLQYSPDPETARIFLVIGTIFALTAYIVQPILFIRLRYRIPALRRPFSVKSFGIPVAIINLVIATSGLVGMVVLNTTWQWCLLWVAIGYACLVPFYIFVVRHNLMDSPEKLFIRRQLDTMLRESLISAGSQSPWGGNHAPDH